ncbi:hypothetical protein ACEQ8H_008872 [Pleosporales sp. CAS-2024a]
MTKRSRDSILAPSDPHFLERSQDVVGTGSQEDADGTALKKARSFMATLVAEQRISYCKAMNLECTYQAPRTTKKDQSMAVAINAIRRLETKIEDLTAAVASSRAPQVVPLPSSSVMVASHCSPASVLSQPSPVDYATGANSTLPLGMSPQTVATPAKSPFTIPETQETIALSFSQHRVAIWPAVQNVLPSEFTAARAELAQDYIVDIESQRAPLPTHIDRPFGTSTDSWLMSLPQSVIKGLADAYFAVYNRINPILDKYFFRSSTLGTATENEFGYDIESCLVLLVLALGCLAVKAHEEGDFALPSRSISSEQGFVRPDWYELICDASPGLNFFNEARKRFGFLMCLNDLQAGQFYMLSTLYYAQILRPLDSWATVNRAALCCTTILSSTDTLNFDEWEGDMFSRLFWNTLMYETVITQELDHLPHSGLLEYEPGIPLPKFTSFPRPKTSIAGLLTDEHDSFFNFHFLAQAAHRIILTRIKQSLYFFAERDAYPGANITAEMHHQLEQWRSKLPPSLQFSDTENVDGSPSPAHVVAKAMLRSRYLVAKFHIGRPFLYKALHAPAFTSEAEYDEVRRGLQGGMYWPTTMGPCAQMLAALPLKFGWCCQCFGQVLLFHAVSRSPDPRLRATLPDGWQDWVQIMMVLIENCGRSSPGIAKDAELLRLV